MNIEPISSEKEFIASENIKERTSKLSSHSTNEGRREFLAKLKASIEKRHEPTAKEIYEKATFEKLYDPEKMSDERLQQFQEHGWFKGYEPRNLTDVQIAEEDEEFNKKYDAAYPEKKLKPELSEEAKRIIKSSQGYLDTSNQDLLGQAL